MCKAYTKQKNVVYKKWIKKSTNLVRKYTLEFKIIIKVNIVTQSSSNWIQQQVAAVQQGYREY